MNPSDQARKAAEAALNAYIIDDANVDEVSEIIQRAIDADRWIPVSDRLPEDRVDVIAFGKLRGVPNKVFEAWCDYTWCDTDEDHPEWCKHGYYGGDLIVSHWQPLPAKPEDGR